jgi:hypothetical protein
VQTATLYFMELRDWTDDAMVRIETELRADPHWSRVLSSRATRTVHLAIFVQPFLGRVLDGTKLIESRFSVRRCAPFQRVWNGDIVLVKEASGPVRAVCEVGTTWFFDLGAAPADGSKHTQLEEIRARFGDRICAPDETFWESCKGTSYASLVELNELRLVNPIACPKRDRRGWVVLHDREEEPPPARRSTRLRSVPTW